MTDQRKSTNAQHLFWQYGGQRIYSQLFVRSSASFPADGISIGLAIDATGILYVADRGNLRIRKIALDGSVSTLAGDGPWGDVDGPGATARFYEIYGIGVDEKANVYTCDDDTSRIRKIAPNGTVSTFAGSDNGYVNGNHPLFAYPEGLVADAAGHIFVSEMSNENIRLVQQDGSASTLAGIGEVRGNADGPLHSATFNYPSALALGKANQLFVMDQGNHCVRMVEW